MARRAEGIPGQAGLLHVLVCACDGKVVYVYPCVSERMRVCLYIVRNPSLFIPVGVAAKIHPRGNVRLIIIIGLRSEDIFSIGNKGRKRGC